MNEGLYRPCVRQPIWPTLRADNPNDPTLNEYQEKAASTAVYPDEAKLVYTVLGLIGEVGELADKLYVTLFPPNQNIPKGVEDATFLMLWEASKAGAAAEKLKKAMRSGEIPVESLKGLRERVERLTVEQKEELLKEAGDIGWYWAGTVRDLDAKLGAVAKANLDKLASRKERGCLQGSGDNR